METIRHESERALHDMKRLLGVFGGSDHADYADVDALINQANAAAGMGCTIRKTVSGQPRVAALGAQASTAMYRMVQEALTNVRKYGGPNVTVQISEIWGADGLHVTVADNGRGASSSLDGHKPGYGLIGMRERIGAIGGSVTSGRQTWRRLRGVRLRAVQHCLNAVRGCCAGVRKLERGVFRCGVFGRGNHADGGPDDRNGFNGDGYRECRGRQ